MNSTFEVIYNVFHENGESKHIQSQIHLINLRLISAKKDLLYFNGNFPLWFSPLSPTFQVIAFPSLASQ